MPEDRVEPEQVLHARSIVRQEFGSALEEKASDEFCLAAARRSPTREVIGGGGGFTAGMGFGFPTGPGMRSALPSVIEFGGDERSDERLGSGEHVQGWAAAAEALRNSSVTAVTEPAMGLLRQGAVNRTRSARYLQLDAVYKEIERLSGTAQFGLEFAGPSGMPTLVNQICWLNRSVRTWAGPDVLAGVSSDETVVAIDVPRRLTPDADVRNHHAIALPPLAAATGLDGEGVTVAVIDSEVGPHPALAGRVVHRQNFTSETWGSPDSHGTAVAGIIGGADPANAGIAPAVTIYNYKVLATTPLLNGDDFSGGVAIQRALEDGVAIANCSWGAGPVRPAKSREAVAAEEAWRLGMAVVKSAGNNGPGASTMTSPSEADGIVVVGATDIDGTAVADYSSRGPANTRPGPDVVAPGGDGNVNISCCLVGGGFGDAGAGTSYATPHVTGLLALLLQQNPNLLPDDLRTQLIANPRTLAGFGLDAQGAGLLQAAR